MLVGGLARLAAIAPSEECRGLAARVHDLLPGETPGMTLGFLKLRHLIVTLSYPTLYQPYAYTAQPTLQHPA